METENTFEDLEKRKAKVLDFLKKKQVWVIGLLIVALVLGIYIRTLPMQDHGGFPGLWDFTTNNWTLGPDLDPWLFTRYAGEIIDNGSVAKIDMMRNTPLGFETAKETMLLPKMIVWTYSITNLFYSANNIEFSAALFPVIMFALTIISFFLFVREVFVRKTPKSKTKANIIALISTFFMIVTPVFLSRTIAGIPEKESAAFFFMFLTFYLFLKAWKSEKIKFAVLFGVLTGISTSLMGAIWGGVMFIYIPLAISVLIAFILNKVDLNQYTVYIIWILISTILTLIIQPYMKLKNMITSLDMGIAFLVLIIMVIHFLIWNTKISKNETLKKIKLPKQIISLIFTILLVIIFATVFVDTSFVMDKAKAIHQQIFKPVTGRWNTTVAENRQPYFIEWEASFGPHVGGIALMFWAFVIGSIALFKKMLKRLKKKDAWILTGSFALVLLGMIFSRYSGSSIFNGENFISKFVYYGAVLLFFYLATKIYLRYNKEDKKLLKKIRFEYIFLLVVLLISIFSARGAVRLIMVLGPIAPIFLAYLNYESVESFFKEKNETKRLILGILAITIILLSIFIFWTYYGQIKAQSYNMIPSGYTQQWQKAMDWVRTETPQESVFGHWWDYGYWVQSIGKRATVLDGGNAISFWNYWMGRLVLTGDNQKDALEFLYTHDANYFLIDSSDIGKYGAFSSIGSDEDFDRVSWIGVMGLDEKQTYETKEETTYVYSGGIALDEDLIIEENGKEIFLPSGNTGIGAAIVPSKKDENGKLSALQPYVIMVYNGVQHKVNVRYVSTNDGFYDFKSGINATIFIFPSISSNGQNVQTNPIGMALFLSPRLMRGMLVQKYILNDPFNNFPNFKIAHVESDLIISSLRSQGMNLPEFVYYQGIRGPIKIWEIEYPEGFSVDEKTKEKYLDRDSSKYVPWKF